MRNNRNAPAVIMKNSGTEIKEEDIGDMEEEAMGQPQVLDLRRYQSDPSADDLSDDSCLHSDDQKDKANDMDDLMKNQNDKGLLAKRRKL